MRWAQSATAQSTPDSAPDDGAPELCDVPAAVVCAMCGQPDCQGCDDTADEPTHGSGVMTIIPWERPGLPLLSRWWSTAHLATLNHRAFFSGLPDGSVRPALAFALASEVAAVSGLVLTALLLAVPVMPWLPRLVLVDPVVRGAVIEALAYGVPLLTGVMVGIHLLHGVFTDSAARREGSRKRGRGMRFGLYGCAWDVITLPLGLLILALQEGPAAAARTLPLGLTAPSHAVRSYLTGVHGLPPDSASRAARRAARSTGFALVMFVVTFAATVLVLSR